MQNHYLSKSDFKVAQTCPTKLYYRKRGYPTTNETNEHLTLLSDQGYLVEAMARALYPNGQWVGQARDAEAAARETTAALTDSCVLFEATFLSRGKLARIDILARHGDVFELIEVKSCSFNQQENGKRLQEGKPNLFRSLNKPSEILQSWREYLEDVTFQTIVLQEVFPHVTIVPYLIMLDSSAPCQIDGLHRLFEKRADSDAPDMNHTVAFAGDPNELARNPILAQVNVAEEVELLIPEVRRQSEIYLDSLSPSLTRIEPVLTTHCRSCEYRTTKGQISGFRECWGELADVQPHILSLYRASSAGGTRTRLVDTLIAQNKASLLDIPEDKLVKKDGTQGPVGKRQSLQITYTRENREWVSDGLGAFLESLAYPLYFVDFETCAPAIPRYRGTRPFENLAFQWSCQTITAPGARPKASEWLQEEDNHPNRAFAEALRRQVGDSGSILVWASHESNILGGILASLKEEGRDSLDVALWIDDVLANGRLIDLNRVTLNHYFHPRMGGSTSLKIVTDAIWHANADIRRQLPQFVAKAEDGELLSPYRTLSPMSIDGRETSVAEGTGAILAYYRMIDCMTNGAAAEAKQLRQLLLSYCDLDTLAMVMVWWHWRELVGQAN